MSQLFSGKDTVHICLKYKLCKTLLKLTKQMKTKLLKSQILASITNVVTILMLTMFLFLSILWFTPQMSAERKIFILIFSVAIYIIGSINMHFSHAPRILMFIFHTISCFLIIYVVVAMWFFLTPVFIAFKYIYFAIDCIFILYALCKLVVNIIHWLNGEKYVIHTYELQFCFYPFAFIAFALI